MVENITQKLIALFVEEQMIREEERDYYEYAMVILIQRILTVSTILIIGYLFHQLIEIGLFLIFFLCLRKRTGGYHAEHFLTCYLLSNAICVYIIGISGVLEGHQSVIQFLLIVSSGIIFRVGTVNHPNMAMEKDEYSESKKRARRVILMESGIIILFYMLDINESYSIYMSMAVILCAALICYAKYIKQEVQEYEEK